MGISSVPQTILPGFGTKWKRQNYNICFERLLQTSLQHILTGIQSICGHNMPILCQHPGQFRLTAAGSVHDLPIRDVTASQYCFNS